jgi:hypothetical protein
VYKAVVSLTAKSGFTFAGVAENSFTHSGATSVANAANSGTVTITFPATTGGGNEGGGGTTGTLKITNVPGGTDTFAVYITTQPVTANYVSIITNFAAVGGAVGSPSGTVDVALYTADGGTTAFSGSGTYSILVIGTTGADTPLIKAVNNRSFSGGSAAINWSDLVDVSALGGDGVLTIRDIPGGTGTFAVYVLPDEVTADNYLTAISSFEAVGAVTASPSGTTAAPLYTASGGTTAFNGTGEYSVLVYSLSPPVALGANYVEFNNGGAEISWNDLEEVSGMTGPAFLDLTDNVWYGNSLAAEGQAHEYRFYAEEGKTYYVSWNDYYNGDNSATANIYVSAAWRSGDTAIFTNASSGYTSPRSFPASKSGYVKITVRCGYYPGTYSLVYWERTGNAALQVNFAVQGGDMNVSGGIKLDKSDNNSITLSLGDASGYTDFMWFLEGVKLEGETESSITLKAEDYGTGLYHLTLAAYKDAVPYSGEITFAVVE